MCYRSFIVHQVLTAEVSQVASAQYAATLSSPEARQALKKVLDAIMSKSGKLRSLTRDLAKNYSDSAAKSFLRLNLYIPQQLGSSRSFHVLNLSYLVHSVLMEFCCLWLLLTSSVVVWKQHGKSHDLLLVLWLPALHLTSGSHNLQVHCVFGGWDQENRRRVWQVQWSLGTGRDGQLPNWQVPLFNLTYDGCRFCSMCVLGFVCDLSSWQKKKVLWTPSGSTMLRRSAWRKQRLCQGPTSGLKL